MPISYRIDKSLGLVFTTAQAALTRQDILTYFQRLREDPDFNPSYDSLIDLRDLIEHPMSAGDIETISGDRVFNQESRRAIVAEKDASFGMARTYEMRREAEPDQIKVFRDMPEACRWLGLDEATNSN